MTRCLALSVLTLVAGVFITAAGCEEEPAIDDECAEFRDDESGAVTIIVENARSTPVFFHKTQSCSNTLDPLLTSPDGEPVSLETASCGRCAAFLDGSGCFDDECTSGFGLIMLAPGSRVVLSWAGTQRKPQTMPWSCEPYGTPGTGDISCYRQERAPSGRYSVHLNAISTATCGAQFDGSPQPCVCMASETEGPRATCAVHGSTDVGDPIEYVAELDYPNDQEVTVRIE